MKKERWTESELLALPSGEHDFFERKSGALLNDAAFEQKLAKAISALANSGGGHLVIGVTDGGSIDGVPKVHKGRTTTRDWVEQKVPNLVSRPLRDFRVHEAEPEAASTAGELSAQLRTNEMKMGLVRFLSPNNLILHH